MKTKTLNKIKTLLTTLAVLVTICVPINQSFAAGEDVGLGFVTQEYDPNDLSTQVPVGKSVTMEEATEYVNTKGFQIIIFLQNIAKPITLVCMVIFALMSVMSGLVNKKGGSFWLSGFFISALSYLLVIYTPLILNSLILFVSTP